MKSFQVKKEDEGQTLIKYLKRIMPKAPNSFFHKMLRKKNITLNGKKAEGTEKIKATDEIKIFVSDDTFDLFCCSKDITDSLETHKDIIDISTDIVYSDDHILIYNKPVGMLSQRDKSNDRSANEIILDYLIHNGDITSDMLTKYKPSVCNRLDRNTGGLLLFAKTLFGANVLNRLLKDRTLEKYYITAVYGNMKKEIHSKAYLFKNDKENIVTISDKPQEGFVEIETKFIPQKYNPTNNITLIFVHLITGKSHQIRCHLKHLGYPMVGEMKYCTEMSRSANKELGLHSQLLYAYKIVFPVIEEYEELSQKTFTINRPVIFDKIIGDK